jgi:hypothetical protein
MKNLDELIELQGTVAIQFEPNIFNVAAHYSENYNGGYWKSYQVENDADEADLFYMMLDDGKEYVIQNCGNFYEPVVMDSKTYSLTVWAHVCNLFGLKLYEDGEEDLAQVYFSLQYYAMRNAEQVLGKDGASLMCRFLD